MNLISWDPPKEPKTNDFPARESSIPGYFYTDFAAFNKAWDEYHSKYRWRGKLAKNKKYVTIRTVNPMAQIVILVRLGKDTQISMNGKSAWPDDKLAELPQVVAEAKKVLEEQGG